MYCVCLPTLVGATNLAVPNAAELVAPNLQNVAFQDAHALHVILPQDLATPNGDEGEAGGPLASNGMDSIEGVNMNHQLIQEALFDDALASLHHANSPRAAKASKPRRKDKEKDEEPEVKPENTPEVSHQSNSVQLHESTTPPIEPSPPASPQQLPHRARLAIASNASQDTDWLSLIVNTIVALLAFGLAAYLASTAARR